MARDKRNFLRMNSDDSPLALPNGDALSLLNCHVFPTYITAVPGNVLIEEKLFTSTQTYTATCEVGEGEPVIMEATANSGASQEEADRKALAEAKRLAEEALVCYIWQVKEDSVYCLVGSDLNKTGMKGWATLERSIVSGEPTGEAKPNIKFDANYVAPVADFDFCTPPNTPVIMIQGDVRFDGNIRYVNYIISSDKSLEADLVVNVRFIAKAGNQNTTRTLSKSTGKWETGEIDLTSAPTAYDYGFTILPGDGYIVSPTDDSFIISVPAANDLPSNGSDEGGNHSGVEPS